MATIGFGEKSAERFIRLLANAGVVTVVDTRRWPDAPDAGYARQRDLPFLLRSAANIGYEHRSALAPPAHLVARYTRDDDWPAYARDFEELVLASPDAKRAMMDLLARIDYETIALLCLEPTPQQCHRRLVAERVRDLAPDLELMHLT
jgi:uncharacterized protein (DUF488 family)